MVAIDGGRKRPSFVDLARLSSFLEGLGGVLLIDD